ncbi:DMT family transporter [Candidatus Saccharibacteria bacterium]|nr:DMT family transporter [Candidatus Saccharibacteria bacterium]
MEKIKKTQLKYYHYLILTGIMWGFTPLVYKKSLLFTSIFGLLVFKYFFGAILLFSVYHKKYVKIPTNVWPTITVFIIIGVLIPSFLYPLGLSKTSALHASFISLAFPFFVYIFASVFLKDKIHKKVIIGSLFASIGLVIIILFGSNGSLNVSNSSSFAGDLIMLASQFFAASGIVFSKRFLVKNNIMPPEQLAFFEYLFSFCGYLILALIFSQTIYYDLSSASSFFWLVMLVTFAGSIPIALYYKSVKHLPAERIPDVNFVSPLVGSFVAVALLNDSVTPAFILGAFILFIGLLFSNNKLHPLIWGTHLHQKERSLISKVLDIEKSIVKKSKAIYYDIIP